VSDFSINTE